MAVQHSKIRTFGEFIRHRRRQKGLTQAEMVEQLAQRGTKQYQDSSATNWEKNRAMPPIGDPKFVRALAAVLDVSEAEILQAAGFAVNDNPPEELSPEIRELLDHATPDQLSQIAAIANILLKRQNDEANK